MQSASPISSSQLPSAASQTQVTLPRALTIRDVSSLKRAFAVALQAGADVQVGGSGVEETDTIGLQLLVVARRAALEAGVQWNLVNASSPLCEHARRVGLAEHLALSQ